MSRKPDARRVCNVPNCVNNNPHDNMPSLFTLPKDHSVKKQWLDAMSVADNDVKNAEQFKVCQNHFLAEDILAQGKTHRRLSQGAIPKVFSTTPGVEKSSADQSGGVTDVVESSNDAPPDLPSGKSESSVANAKKSSSEEKTDSVKPVLAVESNKDDSVTTVTLEQPEITNIKEKDKQESPVNRVSSPSKTETETDTEQNIEVECTSTEKDSSSKEISKEKTESSQNTEPIDDSLDRSNTEKISSKNDSGVNDSSCNNSSSNNNNSSNTKGAEDRVNKSVLEVDASKESTAKKTETVNTDVEMNSEADMEKKSEADAAVERQPEADEVIQSPPARKSLDFKQLPTGKRESGSGSKENVSNPTKDSVVELHNDESTSKENHILSEDMATDTNDETTKSQGPETETVVITKGEAQVVNAQGTPKTQIPETGAQDALKSENPNTGAPDTPRSQISEVAGEEMKMDVDTSDVESLSAKLGADLTETEYSTPNESGNESASSQGIGKKSRRRGDVVYTKSRKKGGKKSLTNGAQKSKLHFKCTNFIKEDHKQPIFGVQFYTDVLDSEEDPFIFGTVGSNRISIYGCGEDCGRINLFQSYVDSDPEESFYTCTWTTNPETAEPIFCYAGAKGILHVLNTITRQCVLSLQGHGSAINELKTHPLQPELILSTSKDHTSRLWNIKTGVCVLILGGVNGHRDEVLSVDFDIMGSRIVSCGMDHSLKFWSLESDKIKKSIKDSFEYSVDKENKAFQTLPVHYPEYTTREVHRNYVDCVTWHGDLILSKSCDNQVVLWSPKQPVSKIMAKECSSDVGVFVLHKFDITLCDIWFMRFAVDYNQKLLAIGNQVGKIYLYDLDVDHPSATKPTILSYSRCNSAVRQISFNKSAKILVAVCDDGTIWRWDKQ